MTLLLCFQILLWVGIVLLIVVPCNQWWQRQYAPPYPFAGIAGALFLISFFKLPWLNLQPLKLIGLDWLVDLAPMLEPLLGKWGLKGAQRGVESFGLLEPFFEPRGWLTLLLVTNKWLMPTLLLLGTLSFIFILWLLFKPTNKAVGAALMVTSAANLLFLFYFLPDIDGMGERPFPNIMSLAQPLLGAHLEWIGPIVMIISLCLMLMAGAQACLVSETYTAASDPPVYQR